MKTLLAACEALERASHVLLESLAAGDDAVIDAAMAGRAGRFEVLREASRQQSVGPSERVVLARIGALDDRLRAFARDQQRAIQRERQEIATSGRALRALRGAESPPRFVARHA